MLVTTISSQSRQENYVSEQDTSSDQHPEISETKKEPDKTFCRAFWRRATIYGTAIVIAVCIAPSIRFDNEAAARFGLAAATATLFAFIDLLIYLFAYKEELSGYLFKIFNPIKNFTLHTWEKINSIKKFFKALSIFTGATLLIVAELFLIYKTFDGFSSHAAEIRNLPNDFNFSSKSDELSKIQGIRFNTFLYAIGALLLATLPALFFTKKIKSTLEKHILRTFVPTVIIGGILAFLIPTFLYNYGFIGDTKDLTTALLGVTGGVVALFSLIKSHQKSELEREQLDTQKQKDARDHIHQLHSSYSDRFDKAVVELNTGDAKAAFAAVYKLIHLGDEWLNHNVLANEQNDQEKLKKKADEEIQTIINVLCKYIRTMPKNFTEEDLKNINSLPKTRKETLNGEIEIRRLIFSEISDRLSKPEKDNYAEEELLSAGKEIPITRGAWSKFKFNFTQAPIFYPLVNLTIENSDFKGATFYPSSLLININFHGETDFSYSNFINKPSFYYLKFYDFAKFTNVDFRQGAQFRHVIFCSLTAFSASRFRQSTIFLDCTFWGGALFLETRFRCPSEFKNVKFKKLTLFNKSIFKNDASFESVEALNTVSFRESKFMNTADFYKIGSVKKISFHRSQFHGKFMINYILNFHSADFKSALFSCKEIHTFGSGEYLTGSKRLFYSGFSQVTLKNNSVTYTYTIPPYAQIFDPDSWDEQNKEYTSVSATAKPIDKFDNQGKPPSK